MTLAEYFAATGIKDEAFAEKAKISRSMITKLRLRTATPSAGAAMRIFGATDGQVTLADLMPLIFGCETATVQPVLSLEHVS